MSLRIGVDVGQRTEPSGLCVVEAIDREREHGKVEHYFVRFLQRIAAGTNFPDIAKRTKEVVGSARDRVEDTLGPQIFIDATGLGEPILQLFQSCLPERCVRAVYFNHGDRWSEVEDDIHLGKAYLVARLQALLQTGRLHLPKTPQAETLAEELLSYDIRIDEKASDLYGAFRVGSHDDLVTALGLAVQKDRFRSVYEERGILLMG